MKPWSLIVRLQNAIEKDDKEKVGEITEEIRNVIDKDLVKISSKYSDLFFGVLLAEATLWVEAMKQRADETDLHICDMLLSHSVIVNVRGPEQKGTEDTKP